MDARILFVSDTHLGFDLPAHPRVERLRRGPDFFDNFERALAPAWRGEADLVVHGGDLLFRSKVAPRLAQRAYEPLRRLAEHGVPVCLVPGNHERSALPYGLLALHPRLHVFDRPRTVRLDVRGLRLAVTGFPYAADAGLRIAALLREAAWGAGEADARVLCMHQIVEGATVGPSNYQFRSGADVVPGGALPRGLAAVLCGHVHRAQVLRRDLAGRPLAAPVLYAGSVERTSAAEREETKGFFRVRVSPQRVSWAFEPLPARPMVDLEVDAADLGSLREALLRRFPALPARALVRVAVGGPAAHAVSAAWLRALAPAGCIVEAARGGPPAAVPVGGLFGRPGAFG